MTLRETAYYVATPTKRGVRITAKDKNVVPKCRVISEQTWEILTTMTDSEFDGSCVLELGIGTFRR